MGVSPPWKTELNGSISTMEDRVEWEYLYHGRQNTQMVAAPP